VGGDLQLGGVPQLIGQVRAFLGDDELDDRGGVEVRVQRL
jgi:hypothetical protein